MGSKLDSPLSEKGRQIAAKKGDALKQAGFSPDKVYTSKLKRARETAEIILSSLGATPTITELESLNERDFGRYDGQPYKYVLDAFEREGENPETIETVDNFVRRVVAAYEDIKQSTTGTTLVVTHSNPEMVMQTAAFNPDKLQRFWELGDPAYCEGFEIDL